MEDRRVVPHSQGLPPRFPEDSLRSLVYDDGTCNIALLAQRECFERAGPDDESLIANEDWDMWLRVARHSRFAFVDQVLASRTVPIDKLFAAPDLPLEVEAMRSSAYANVHLFRGLRWWQAGHLPAAMQEFRHVVRLSNRPALAVLRIAWRVGLHPVLERSSPGRRITRSVARRYRR